MNGIEKNSSAQTGILGGTGVAMYIGSYTPTTYMMDGKVDIIQAYNRTLTPQEILNNYNAQKSRFGH